MAVKKLEMKRTNSRAISYLALALSLLIMAGKGALAQKEGIFNIGTYNLRYANHGDSVHGNGWAQRLEVISGLIRFHDFDIFGTQEGLYPQLQSLRDKLPGYNYIGIGREDGIHAGEHSAIFFKKGKFDVLDHGDFWLSTVTDHPNKGWDAVLPRICTWGKFRFRANGQVFYMFNLHMDHVGVLARAESAKLILAKIREFPAGTPIILTGDFNVDQNSESYKLINESGVLKDCYDLGSIRYAENGTFNNFRSDNYTESRIDHIFVSRQFGVRRYGVLLDTYRTKNDSAAAETTANAPKEIRMSKYTSRTPSDHFPVMAQLLTGAQPVAEHVVIITVDGFRPALYTEPVWHTPVMHGLMKDGAYAQGVNSVFPSMTYPSHTTIVTGVQPVTHGIYYNAVFEATGQTGKIYWNDSSIKVPTLWSAAQAKGMTSAALLWPVSGGAPVKYNIPDNADLGRAKQEEYSRPAGFTAELRHELFNDSATIDYGKDHNVARIASYVIKKDRPNLMTIHFFSVDHYSHEQGRNGSKVEAAVADADSSVGIIIDALKDAGIWDKTVLIVTGDHGFGNVSTMVNPNIWLVNAGLIKDVKTDDWKAQFFSVGGSSYLYLKDRKDKATLQQVRKILADLPADQKKYIRIIERARMDAVGGNPEVGFALSAENGASFGNAKTGDAIKPGKGGTHGYYPDFYNIRTGFIAHGPGIKKGAVIPIMNLRDIAPTVAKLLGLDMPAVEGKIPVGLLK